MTYTAGLIGAGAVSEWHGHAYAETDGLELAAIAEVDKERLATAAERWGVDTAHCYEGHQTMLEAEDLDVVSVATPTLYHHEHTLDTVRIGDPDVVWCEKPIAASVTEARELVDACAASDAELVINHARRWVKPYRRLRRVIREEGILGEALSVNSQFKLELLRNGTHFVDTLYWILGENAVRTSGYLTGEAAFDEGAPTVATRDCGGGGYIVFDGGTFVTLDCTVPRDSFSGWFFFTGSRGRLYVNESDEVVRYWSIDDGDHVREPMDIFDGDWDGWPAAFEEAAASIVSLLDGDGENVCPGREAVHVQEILVSLFVSQYTDSTMTLPLDEALRDLSIPSW